MSTPQLQLSEERHQRTRSRVVAQFWAVAAEGFEERLWTPFKLPHLQTIAEAENRQKNTMVAEQPEAFPQVGRHPEGGVKRMRERALQHKASCAFRMARGKAA
jgi:hypothetical protein